MPQQNFLLFVYFACLLLIPDRIDAEDSISRIIIPALDTSRLDERSKGLVLVEELNCVACHKTEASIATSSKKSPRLANVASRLNPYYLQRFIQSPHATKLGTTMPDVMAHLDEQQRERAAKSIVHFLLSLKAEMSFDLQAIDRVAAEHGEMLFHTVGCVACHSPRNEKNEEVLQESSVPLGALEKKYNVRSLVDFLRSPHKTRPSGRMPDMHLPQRDIERISHYLLRDTNVPGHLNYTLLRGRVWEGLTENVEKDKSGQVDSFDLKNFEQVNGNSAIIFEGYLKAEHADEYTFYLEMNGGELWINDEAVVILKPSSRRGVKKTKGTAQLRAGWNHIKLTYIHAGKEPKLHFEMEGEHFDLDEIPPSMLSISETPIAPYQRFQVNASLAAEGKKNFATLHCANCHDDVKVESKDSFPLSKLTRDKGCLSVNPGPWPQFRLDPQQGKFINSVLPNIETVRLTNKQTIDKSLVTFNCIACHERADLGGVLPERNHLFTGSKAELGNQGRVPPPLTHVGAKLKKEWIGEVILRGKTQRDYLATRMPLFGENNVKHLVSLFEKVDQLEQVPFDKIEDIEAYRSAGHKLVGTDGFSCIACHDFNGQKAAGPGAMEIIHSTERLKKDWFFLFLLNPNRFTPNTVMPSAWPGGHAFKKDILGGDTRKQIESIWIYLKDGTRAKNPKGLSRKASEVRVTDVAEIRRGRGNAGYRGIAVGYPERINLAFDSEEMNLRLLWKGDFVSTNHGSFTARGGDRVQFPQGIPFYRLKSMDDDWPYKKKTDYLFPQDHGYQFRGYYLDKKRRPTFMYQYGEAKVEEFFEDVVAGNQAYFKRTLSFDAPRRLDKIYFRAATGKSIDRKSATAFSIDRLTIQFKSDHQGLVRYGEPMELLVPLSIPKGKSTLALEYKW